MMHLLSVENSPAPFPALPRRSGSCKRVLLISGGNQSTLEQYRLLHRQNSRIVVLDAPDHWAKMYLQTGLVEAFIEVDLTERASLFDEIIDALMNCGLLFDEVIAFSDSAAGLAARLAYAMGLSDDFGGTQQ